MQSKKETLKFERKINYPMYLNDINLYAKMFLIKTIIIIWK